MFMLQHAESRFQYAAVQINDLRTGAAVQGSAFQKLRRTAIGLN